VNIIRGKREDPEAGPADGAGGGTLARRNVLGGLAALPVLVSIGSATPALAATAARSGSVPAAAGDLMRGTERRYNAPLLAPGTRLVLPARRSTGDDGQPPDLPSGGHVELPGGGQRDYLV
jgi:hypothetical protein